jgi:hypothetical protein
MAVYAMRSEGATSLTQDWKNSMGIISCRGALFLGNARIALTTSSSVRLWVREALVSAETLAGTLSGGLGFPGPKEVGFQGIEFGVEIGDVISEVNLPSDRPVIGDLFLHRGLLLPCPVKVKEGFGTSVTIPKLVRKGEVLVARHLILKNFCQLGL